MINLHNTENSEYLETQVDDPATREMMEDLFAALAAKTSFDPSQKLRVSDMQV